MTGGRERTEAAALLQRRSAELLSLMRSKGLPTSGAAGIFHQFLAPGQLEAAKLAGELQAKGFRIEEMEPAEKDDGTSVWAVEATLELSPEQAADMAEELVRLAARFESDYCGWAVPD